VSEVSQSTLGAVILSYGRANVHGPVLRTLTQFGARTVLVHNPADEDGDWVPPVVAGAELVALERNRGYAGGMNAGATHLLREDPPEWLLFLTHDAGIERAAIQTLLEAARSDRSIGVLGPVLLLADGSTWSTGVMLTDGRARHCRDSLGADPVVFRDSIDGTAMLVRTRAYLDAGPFEERFFMYWEESELCWRCRRHGWRVGVSARSTATTVPGGAGRPASHAYLLARNGMEFARRSGGGRRMLAFSRFIMSQVWNALPFPLLTKGTRPGAWVVTVLRWIGTVAGLVSFATRRWGPPPGPLVRADRSRVVREFATPTLGAAGTDQRADPGSRSRSRTAGTPA
jgi:GT2 family glycosyltransferase